MEKVGESHEQVRTRALLHQCMCAGMCADTCWKGVAGCGQARPGWTLPQGSEWWGLEMQLSNVSALPV